MITPHLLASLYSRAHDVMRNVDGLQPQEAFDELLKVIYVFEKAEENGEDLPKSAFRLGSLDDTDDASRIKFIRRRFKESVREKGSAAHELWSQAEMRLSDAALRRVDAVFAGTSFRGVPFDIRSAALREFLGPEVRKGLGIYLTPDQVVAAAVSVLSPRVGARVIDPACGSGTFLIEVLRQWGNAKNSGPIEVFGVDKNPRMLLLADLNLSDGAASFQRALDDTLSPRSRGSEILTPASFDYVVTNPPFGVYVESPDDHAAQFRSCRYADGTTIERQQSEMLFLEQCLNLLKPGGELGIVLPRSVLLNQSDRLAAARAAIADLGYVFAVMWLPPETFYTTGTQTNAVVLFMRRYSNDAERDHPIRVASATVTNVGVDSTGRPRANPDLEDAVSALRSLTAGEKATTGALMMEMTKHQTLIRAPEWSTQRTARARHSSSGVLLGDIVSEIRTGRTPARSAYTDEGLFLIKVGNLTGCGIDWIPRDRNFVNVNERAKREKSGLLVKRGDILLTSSAHSPVYIAKKCDIISDVPASVGGAASLVGEVMLVRPKAELIDPWLLLAFLRAGSTIEYLQALVRGQTAHLNPDDLASVVVPSQAFERNEKLSRLLEVLKREQQLSLEQNALSVEQQSLLSEAFP